MEPEVEVYVDVRGKDRPSKPISRVTYRVSIIRERSGEEYQAFPPGGYAGTELPVDNQQPAYVMPGTKLHGEVLLSFGWIESPTIVAVLNRTRWKADYLPSPEEQQVIADSLIGIGFNGTTYPLVVRPGQLQPLTLAPGTQVYLKALGGTPEYALFGV